MLDAVKMYWCNLSDDRKERFRFHHISTDEVYGSLGTEGLFDETTSYDPHSRSTSNLILRVKHRVTIW